MNESGLDEVSIRKVAARLGVQGMSLYWHVESKGALHFYMSEALLAQNLASIPPCTDWQSWLLEFGRALFRGNSAYRDSARLIFLSQWSDERLRELRVEFASRLMPFGLDEAIATEMQSSVQALMIGWIGLKQSPFADYLDAVIAVDNVAMKSLEVLVAGWDASLERDSPKPSVAELLPNTALDRSVRSPADRVGSVKPRRARR